MEKTPPFSVNQSTLFMAVMLATLGISEYYRLETLRSFAIIPSFISIWFFLIVMIIEYIIKIKKL